MEQVPDTVHGGVVDRKPLIKDRTAAAREIMKRYPLSDPVVQAHLKKIAADTRISEARANNLESGGRDVTEAVGNFIDLLTEGVDQNHDKHKQSSDS